MTSQEENELICEKLLGWKLGGRNRFGTKMWLDNPYGDDGAQWNTVVTPSFDTWAEAGLILDALSAAGIRAGLENLPSDHWAFRIFKGAVFQFGTTGPLAIRTAALEYIKSAG